MKSWGETVESEKLGKRIFHDLPRREKVDYSKHNYPYRITVERIRVQNGFESGPDFDGFAASPRQAWKEARLAMYLDDGVNSFLIPSVHFNVSIYNKITGKFLIEDVEIERDV